jgi:hypothetical protein
VAIDEFSGDDLLDQLYELSGNAGREPEASQYLLVASSLHHPREDVRERAIFIGGLRWFDKTILGYFKGVLATGEEPCDDNRRLMIESLVSEAIERGEVRDSLVRFLAGVQESSSAESITAKAAFIGIKRLRGEISKIQFAQLDYGDVTIE